MAFNGKTSSIFGDPLSAYVVVCGVMFNRVYRQATISLAMFKDQASRERYKETQQQIFALAAEATKTQSQIDAATVLADRRQFELILSQLTIDFQKASAVLAEIKAVDDPTPINVGPNVIGDLLNSDGDISTAKVYTYLKTLDRFKDASDAQPVSEAPAPGPFAAVPEPPAAS